MRRLFARNLVFVLGINLLVKPAWIFGIDRQVQNMVGHAAFGTYSPLLNLCVIFQILLDFGINNYNSKAISEDPAQLPRLFPMMLSARLALMLVFAVVVFSAALLLGYRSAHELLLLGGIIGFQSLNMLMMFLRSNVAALHRFRLDGLLSIADRGLMILMCGALLLIPATAKGFSIYTFVAVQLVCYGLAALLALLVLRRLARIRFTLSLQPAVVWRIMRESFPYALLIFLMAIYMRSDILLIKSLSPHGGGAEQAGIYAAAYRPLDAFNMLAVLLAGILLPLFSRMLAERQNAAPIVRLCMNLLLPLSIIAAACAVAFGQEIMVFLYPAAGPGEGRVFSWLMATVPAYVVLYIYSTLLTAGGKLRQLHRISALGIAVNLSVCWWLIPRYGALGGAVAACCTMAAVGACFILTAHRQFGLPHNARWVASLMTYAGLAALLAWVCRLLPVPWAAQMVVLCAAGGVLIFLFRFISLNGLKKLVRRE